MRSGKEIGDGCLNGIGMFSVLFGTRGRVILDLVEVSGLGRLEWERKGDDESKGNGLDGVGGLQT